MRSHIIGASTTMKHIIGIDLGRLSFIRRVIDYATSFGLSVVLKSLPNLSIGVWTIPFDRRALVAAREAYSHQYQRATIVPIHAGRDKPQPLRE